ncbi:MAG: hypothetical protein U1A72_11885 [Sulfuritalea sp.]|nr:hypothetical protein [Sulfuritalea sp.]
MKSTATESTDNRPMFFENRPMITRTITVITVTGMDAELSALVARRDKTRDLKQAMMQELLTGRIRLA